MNTYRFYRWTFRRVLVCLASTFTWLHADVWDSVGEAFSRDAYNEATQLLETAIAEDPDNADLHRILGVSLIRMDRHADAELSLREALRLNPDSIAARYDLAQVLAVRGNLRDAEHLLQEVIERAPDSVYAARAREVVPGLRQLRETLLVQDKPTRWSLYTRLGVEQDDNVTARSRSAPEGTESTTRLIGSVYVSHRFPDQRLDPAFPTLEIGGTYYRTHHTDDDFSDFDVESIGARAALSRNGRLFGAWLDVGLEASYTETSLGGDAFNTDLGLGTHLRFQPFSNALTTLKFSAHDKSYDQTPAFPEFFSRDGWEYEAAATTHLYLLENRLVLGAGYAYLWNDVDGVQFRLNRHRIHGSATLSLPAKWRLALTASHSSEDYDDFVPEPKRDDDVLTLHASLSRPLWNPAWRAEAHGTHTTADSSREFAEYDRTVYGLAITWSP